MMKITSILKKEKTIFHDLQKDIDNINYIMIKIMLLITVAIFTILLLISLLINDFASLRLSYIYPLLVSVILFIVFHKRPPHFVLLMGIYIFVVVYALVGIYLSAIGSPDSQASSIIGIILLTPLVVIDKTWRISFVTISIYIAFIVSSFLCKDFSIAIDDVVTGFIFTVAGIVLGSYMKNIKLTNISTQHRLKKLSDTDELTRLYNRRKMEQAIKNKKNDFQSTGVIMMDIDFFKQYNDQYGHQLGDACLEEVGACLHRMARLHQLKAYRYGGEEFILLSQSQSYEELFVIANEIKREIKRLKIEFNHSPFHVITITAGVSEMTVCRTSDVYELIDMADKALYHGKENGRNKVVGYTVEKR